MLKIEVRLKGQIEQKLKCHFCNNFFLAFYIFYYYAILLLCFILGKKIINSYAEVVLP